MFLSMLSEPQKKAFLALAARYVAEDGLVERKELGWMDGLKREMSMSQQRAGDEPPEELFPLFDSRSSQIIAILEIIRLGYVDGEHSPAESVFVAAMARAFRLSPDLLRDADAWASRHAALTREALELMRG